MPNNMFNTKEINTRFLSCFPGKKRYELATLFGVSRSFVSQWVIGAKQVPWDTLKQLVDAEQISWNWLLEGIEPKFRPVGLAPFESGLGSFETPGINGRFLDLFLDMNQKELAAHLGVTQPLISSWKRLEAQVPWDTLKQVVDSKRISWEWLLEGLPPIFY